jgi:hypothetical protein
MKRMLIATFSFCFALSLIALGSKLFARHNTVRAQVEPAQAEHNSRRARCSNRTASGTYGYRMTGQLIGNQTVPFLVNGIFTHYPNGTMDAEVLLTLGEQQIPGTGTEGRFQTNEDCTGSGKFIVPVLNNLEITYNFIATDGGNQIELLNTNPGIVLHGVGRRISQPGFAPRCNSATVAHTYGYRLDGSLPGIPFFVISGTFTHWAEGRFNGTWKGTDTFNIMGQQYLPRENSGTYTIKSNCRGTGFYKDNLGNSANYVFVAVDGGDTLYIQGADPGIKAAGVARRVR